MELGRSDLEILGALGESKVVIATFMYTHVLN